MNPINWWSNGVPLRAEEYIHRLGRTGRAGANGQGLLLLHEFERGAKGGDSGGTSNLQDQALYI